FLKPGEGPRTGPEPGPFHGPGGVARLHFIQTAAVCHPDAQSRPKMLPLAVSSLRWKGCGSYLRANSTMASGVNVYDPIGTATPMRKNSSRVIDRHPPASETCRCAPVQTRFPRAD